MYTGPVALISLLVFLPVFAAVAALVYSSMQSAALQIQDDLGREISRMASKIVASEITYNTTLSQRIVSGQATQADLEYLASKASHEISRIYGVPPTISLKIAVFNQSLIPEEAGFDLALNNIANYTYVPRTPSTWSIETVILNIGGEQYYVLVQAGY